MSLVNREWYLFISCSVVFLVHQYMQKVMHAPIPLLDSYLDPVLFIPITLHLVTLERRWMLGIPGYKLSMLQIAGYFVLISVIGEIVFPYYSKHFTADILDVVGYFAGAALYAVVTRPCIDAENQNLA